MSTATHVCGHASAFYMRGKHALASGDAAAGNGKASGKPAARGEAGVDRGPRVAPIRRLGHAPAGREGGMRATFASCALPAWRAVPGSEKKLP